jgi:lipopolysaccharide transport system permease protein
LLSDIKSPSLVWSWPVGIPVLLTVQASLTFAAVTVIATLNAFLRDLEQLVRVFLLLLFYITPVLYPVSIVPKNLEWLPLVNPFSLLIISWRALLVDNLLSPYILMAAGYALMSLLIAFPIYRKMGWKLAEVVCCSLGGSRRGKHHCCIYMQVSFEAIVLTKERLETLSTMVIPDRAPELGL